MGMYAWWPKILTWDLVSFCRHAWWSRLLRSLSMTEARNGDGFVSALFFAMLSNISMSTRSWVPLTGVEPLLLPFRLFGLLLSPVCGLLKKELFLGAHRICLEFTFEVRIWSQVLSDWPAFSESANLLVAISLVWMCSNSFHDWASRRILLSSSLKGSRDTDSEYSASPLGLNTPMK